jgi:hypothetical protein
MDIGVALFSVGVTLFGYRSADRPDRDVRLRAVVLLMAVAIG